MQMLTPATRKSHDITLEIMDAWISEMSQNKFSAGQQEQMMVASVTLLLSGQHTGRTVSLIEKYSHLASDTDLVCGETCSALVFPETGAT